MYTVFAAGVHTIFKWQEVAGTLCAHIPPLCRQCLIGTCTMYAVIEQGHSSSNLAHNCAHMYVHVPVTVCMSVLLLDAVMDYSCGVILSGRGHTGHPGCP